MSSPSVKYALEQAFLHRVLGDRRRGLPGQPDQAMGEQRVGAQRLVHVELEADLGGGRSDAREDRLGAFASSELLRVGLDDRSRHAGGGRRVELIGVVGHIEDHLDAVGRQGGFRLFETGGEASFADVAPRADHVGPHLDRHGRSRGAVRRNSFVRRHGGHGMRLSSGDDGRRRESTPAGHPGDLLCDARRRVDPPGSTSRRGCARLAFHAHGPRARRSIRAAGPCRPRRAICGVRRARPRYRRTSRTVAVHQWDGCGQLLSGGRRGRALGGADDRAHRRPAR